MADTKCPYRAGRCGQCDHCAATREASLDVQRGWIESAALGDAHLARLADDARRKAVQS